MARYLYSELAGLMQARITCEKTNNSVWYARHTVRMAKLIKQHMPNGSGIDTGTTFRIPESTPNKLVFDFGYHHMNNVGMYDGWTMHRLVVTPDLHHQFNMRITGPNRNDIKDYLYSTFDTALRTEIK